MHRPLVCRNTMPLVGLLMLALSLAAPLSSAETGTVHLTLYTGGGGYIEPAEIEDGAISLHTRWGDDVVETQIENGSFEVEYGTYLLKVELAGFKRYERELLVRQPRTDVLVGPRIAEIADYIGLPPRIKFEGFVKTTLAPDKLWVRAIPMFGSGKNAFDARPGTDGRFEITVDRDGEFLVLVLHEEIAGRDGSIHLRTAATRSVLASYRTETLEITIP